VRRSAVLSTECERLELWLSEVKLTGDGVTELYVSLLDLYQRTSNTLRRALETLGVQRRPKDVALTLETYLRQPVMLPEKPGFTDGAAANVSFRNDTLDGATENVSFRNDTVDGAAE
jgi:hypothetical protein